MAKKVKTTPEKRVNEIIGRMACPACGEPGQNLKVNKNGNLYLYCDNRCSVRLNPKESRQITDELRLGHVVSWRGFDIRPAGVPVAVKTEEKQTEVKQHDDREQRGNSTDGRPDARPADNAGRNEQRRGILSAWLFDDDDIA